MFKYILSIFIILLFIGCTKQPEYTIKHYQNVNKDAVLNAAKKVLLLSDKQYNIQSKRNSIDAKHDIAIIRGFNVNIKTNHLKLETVQEDGITKAKLFIKTKQDFDKKENNVEETTHNLFWNRLDYLLALNNNWPSCFKNRLKLNFDGVLCDLSYNDNFVPNKSNIIQNITIQEKKIKVDAKIALIKIDLSAFDNIQLPIVEIEETIELVDINTSKMFDLNISIISPITEEVKIIEIEEEHNLTIISYSVSIKVEESNLTIISYMSNFKDENITIDTNSSSIKQDINSSSFQNKFMNSNPDTMYTINLAVLLDMESAYLFIKTHKIEDNSFPIKFKKDKNYVKVMYGIYKSEKEANEALENLSDKLKTNLPTVEGVARKQELFRTNDIIKSKTIYLNKSIVKIQEVDLQTEDIKVISE